MSPGSVLNSVPERKESVFARRAAIPGLSCLLRDVWCSVTPCINKSGKYLLIQHA